MKQQKVCPRCGLPGSGPYPRWAKKPQFKPYYYFAHKSHGKISWCYVPRSWLSNLAEVKEGKCSECASLSGDFFCTWQAAYIRRKLVNQLFLCEGFGPKEKLSN